MDEPQDQVELQLQPADRVTKSRPKALWAALAAVVLAVGALAVTNLGGGDDTAGNGRPIPISLLNRGGTPEAAADSGLAWGRYEAGPDLPALGGTAPVYRLGTVTEAQVRQLADVLGVDGELRHDDGQWTAQDGDHLLNVSEAGGSWWFNGAAVAVDEGNRSSNSSASGGCGPGADCAVASCAAGADCQPVTTTLYDPCAADPVPANVDCFGGTPSVPPDSMPGSTDGTVSSPPVSPIPELPPDAAPCAKVVSTECGTAPDPDLPSKGDAEDLALDLLARTGTDVDGAIVTVDGGVGVWVVSVEPRLDDRPSGLVSQVLVGPDGDIQGANGFLAGPEKVGTYPVLTTHETIDRANETAVRPLGTPVTAAAADVVDTPSAAGAPVTTTTPACKPQPTGIEICEQVDPVRPVDPGASGAICEPTTSATCEGSGSSGDPGTGVAPPPTVPETTIPIEPASVLLVDAAPTLMMIGAIDGSGDVYLVPAYRFTPERGGQVDLVSLSDASIAGPPTTDTTVPPSEVTVEPPVTTPTDCEPLVEGDDTGTTHTIQPCPPTTPTVAVDPVTPQTTTTVVAEP